MRSVFRMNYSLILFGIASFYSLAVPAAVAPISDTNTSCYRDSELGRLHYQLLEEVNFLRTHPAQYAKLVAEHFSTLNTKGVYINHGISYATQEGRIAVNEAIQFLNKVPPTAPLKISKCLSMAAQQHVDDQGPRGSFGHVGSDGRHPSDRARTYMAGTTPFCGENISYGYRTARDMVVQLVVDDGVPTRGHRQNLFNTRYQSLGIGVGAHKTFGYMSVHLLCLNPVQN